MWATPSAKVGPERGDLKQDVKAAQAILVTYRDVRRRKSQELAGYQAAVRVYKGYHPTVSDRAARAAVDEILTSHVRDR